MSFQTTETSRLDEIAADSWYARGVNAVTVEYSTRLFSRYWHGRSRCLEIGPAEGVATSILAEAFPDLTLVEGARKFCDELQQRFPRARVIHSLVEDHQTNDTFDVIVLGHVLEHVDAPADILAHIRPWLAPNGIVCAAVPNARSLHRQTAVLMGLLQSEDSLNENDLHHGHRRIYNPESFRADFLQAGYKIDIFGGYWLKPVSNAQIEADWSAELLQASMQMGERYPDIAGELYIIASSRN